MIILNLSKGKENVMQSEWDLHNLCRSRMIQHEMVYTDEVYVHRNSTELALQNYNGSGTPWEIDLVPEETICFVNGSILYHESGRSIMRILESSGILMINPLETLELCLNKFSAFHHFQINDIPTPKTAYISSLKSLDAALKNVGEKYPIIIKVICGSFGTGVCKIESRDSLVSVLEAFWEAGEEVLLQEFIPIEYDIRTLILNNRIIGSVRRNKAPGDFRTNTVRGGTTETIKLTEEEKELALKTAKAFGGIKIGIDHIRTNQGPMVLEVNGTALISSNNYLDQDRNVKIGKDYLLNLVLDEVIELRGKQ